LPLSCICPLLEMLYDKTRKHIGVARGALSAPVPLWAEKTLGVIYEENL